MDSWIQNNSGRINIEWHWHKTNENKQSYNKYLNVFIEQWRINDNSRECILRRYDGMYILKWSDLYADMALVLHLKYAENLPGKAERLAKVSFRGEFSWYIRLLITRNDPTWGFSCDFFYMIYKCITSQMKTEIRARNQRLLILFVLIMVFFFHVTNTNITGFPFRFEKWEEILLSISCFHCFFFQ